MAGKTGRISGRIKRAISSSLILFAVAGVLAVSNVVMQGRDRGMALGPQSEDQRQFFTAGVDRPDISVFYKRFSSLDKVKIAQNLRRYDDPKLVKLAVTWLTDFDVEARKELQATLVQAAPKQPKALAEQLTAGGGFQKLAVAAALKSAFEKTLPFVIEQLGVAGARANAVEYLVASGAQTAPAILPILNSEDKDTRLAAADAIGKIGYRPGGAALRKLYAGADPADRTLYLAALANLGDPESISIFRTVLNDPKTTSADRASAILGLGRIGDKPSVAVLWSELDKNPLDRRQISESLSVAGDVSLGGTGGLDRADRTEVAGGIQSALADRELEEHLFRPGFSYRSAELAEKRPRLVGPLMDKLRGLDPAKDGRMIEVVVRSLASTDEGQAALKQPGIAKKFRGFIERELSRLR